MTLSVLCIARVSPNRTIAFEVAAACPKSLRCVVTMAHLHPFERVIARSDNHRLLLYPYNEGRAVQLELAPDAARLRSAGRAGSLESKPDGGARPASRDSHACTPCAASASARGPWPRR